jgi:hypothetical protein
MYGERDTERERWTEMICLCSQVGKGPICKLDLILWAREPTKADKQVGGISGYS